MKRTRSRNPIPESVWRELEARDYILRSKDWFEKQLKELVSGEKISSNPDSLIDTYKQSLKVYSELGSVREVVASISGEILEEPEKCRIFSERVGRLCDDYDLTLDELADILGTSHTTIANSYSRKAKEKENGTCSTKISRAFLAAYSLLFNVSPLYLIGLTDKHDLYTIPEEGEEYEYFYALEKDSEGRSFSRRVKIKRTVEKHGEISFLDTINLFLDMDPFMKYIITNLYKPKNEQNLESNINCIFPIILALCNAKKPMRKFLLSVLYNLPPLEECRSQAINLDDSEILFNYALLQDVMKKDRAVLDYINNLRIALLQLDVKVLEHTTLDTLAYLFVVDNDIKAYTYDFLKKCGFLDKPNAYFRKWKFFENDNGILFIKRAYTVRQNEFSYGSSSGDTLLRPSDDPSEF